MVIGRASFCAGFILGGLVFTSATVRAEKLTLGNEGDYPPFSITNPNKSLTGIEPELARELCKKIAADCQINAMEFSGLIPSLVSGKLDMIVSQLRPTPERAAAVALTDPILENPEAWVMPGKVGGPVTQESLKGKAIGIIKGSWNVSIVEKIPGIQLKQYDNIKAIKLDLEAERISAATAGTIALLINFATGDDKSKWQVTKAEGAFGGDAKFSWAVGKSNDKLLQRVNTAIHELFEDCTYSKIRKKYFDVAISSREPGRCQ